MKLTENYAFFWKDKIAQWNKTSFEDIDGIVYNCAEQYMMAQKALLFQDKEAYQKIMESDSPKEQQEIGRTIKNFNQEVWDEHAENIVYHGNILKFSQNKELFDILMSTGNRKLVEASPFDLIWGIGYGVEKDEAILTDESKWRGENKLGKILTKVREDLK